LGAPHRAGDAALSLEVPAAGGETRFASMYDAYEALDDAQKQRLAPLPRGPQPRLLAHAPGTAKIR
jgi:alpha-ketoglutarate-dependent taurine dioxygenase